MQIVIAAATVVLSVLLAGCPAKTAPTADPAPAPVAPPAPPPAPEPCDGKVCTPPERCIDVVGMRPESARKECWITCGGDSACPAGMTCTMIHDGPGQVCVKRD
jgi:hypothetical protein